MAHMTARKLAHKMAQKNKTALGVLCAAMVLVGMLLPGSGPADAQAEATASSATPAGINPVLVQVAATSLVPGVTSDQVLAVDLHWSCADTGVFVERTSGVVTFKTADGGRVDVAAAVRNVQPGNTVSTTVQMEWNESDPVHRFMRRHAAATKSFFTPDAVRTVVVDVRGPVRDPAPTATGSSTNSGAVRASFN
jgi:hypothetical protein